MSGFWYTKKELPLRQVCWYSSIGSCKRVLLLPKLLYLLSKFSDALRSLL